MSSLNKVQLIGRVGKDPEMRRSQNGDLIVNFSIATSDTWRDKSTGERREKTEWHNVVIFNEGLAKVAESYIRKGSKIYISGSLQTRKWQDQSGNDRFSTEVVLQKFNGELILLDGKSADADDAPHKSGKEIADGIKQNMPSSPDDMDDEIPF